MCVCILTVCTKQTKKKIRIDLSRVQWTCDLLVAKTTEVPDCQGFPFRTVGSVGKRERRLMRHYRDGSYNLLSATSSRVETKSPEVRNEYSTKRDFYYTRSNRVSIGNNADSGLGESTPQDFSSCCSSSADSNKPIHITQLQLGGEVHYELPSNQEIYPPVDTTLDAVLQPIISTLTRRQRSRPKQS